MPMRVFLNAKCDGDMSEVENFDDVWLEYIECIGGKKMWAQIEETLSKLELTNKILRAQLSINIILTTNSNEKKAIELEKLKLLNYHISIPAPALDNAELYCKQIEGHVKFDAVKLELLELQKKTTKKEEKEPVYDRDFFISNMIDVQQGINVKITEDDSVRMYCRAFLKCVAHHEMIEKYNSKTQNKRA